MIELWTIKEYEEFTYDKLKTVVNTIDLRDCANSDELLSKMITHFRTKEYTEISDYEINMFVENIGHWILEQKGKSIFIEILLNKSLIESSAYYLNEISTIFFLSQRHVSWHYLSVLKDPEAALEAHHNLKVNLYM